MMGLKASWCFIAVRKAIAATGKGRSFVPSELKHLPKNWEIGFKIASPAFCTIPLDKEMVLSRSVTRS